MVRECREIGDESGGLLLPGARQVLQDEKNGGAHEGEKSWGLLLPGAPRAPPEDLNPPDFMSDVYRTALRGQADFLSEVIVRI